jgi:outer membrane immunogenic protein
MKPAGLAITVLALTLVAVAQDDNRLDFAISGAGVFSKSTSSTGGAVTNTPTKSVAFIGSVRYHFRPKHALEVNFGHTSNSQIFSLPPNSYRVLSSITEITADYVFSSRPVRKFQPFVFAGGGGLRFGPGNTFIDTFPATIDVKGQTAIAFLYGGGGDYPVWRRLSVRLQYRGLLFKEPDFQVPSLFFTGARGHMAEPSAGIVFKF